MEERYPQVCAKCEPLVRDRIRQAGYEAKSDHLRRMMDRSKAGRVARQARNRNWRSLLVFAGAIGYWGSVAGQLAWDVLESFSAGGQVPQDSDEPLSPSLVSCVQQTLQEQRLPNQCSVDLAPYAGLGLIAGILSIWWNPKLRLKVEGRGGRFVGLGEYYKVQLIVMVVRCAFWAVLKDPSSSGLQPTMPPGLHLFMLFFTILVSNFFAVNCDSMLTELPQSVAISRRVVQYDTHPLVTWNEITPAPTPDRKIETLAVQSTGDKSASKLSNAGIGQTPQRFPLEKLAIPRLSPEKDSAIPTPPPEVDDMDWTPSAPIVQHEIRPTISVHGRDQKSVLDGPLPFYGSLPAAPKPPAWNLRSQPSKPKPIEQVVERNPFHRTPTQPPRPWERDPGRPDPVFAPPKFFPMSDHSASTGLESLFDQTFTIKTPEDEGKEDWQQQQQHHQHQQAPHNNARQPLDVQGYIVFQYLRLGLLLASLLAWTLSQNGVLSVPGNYIEVASLGSASLTAGFALLDVLKQPIVHWNGMEILVYFAELAAAVHLGGNLPRVSFEREYFDRYGRLLLVFMAAQEALGLLSLYRAIFAHATHAKEQPANHQMDPSNQDAFNNSPSIGYERPPASSISQSQNSLSSVPPLSFSSTAVGSSFSTQSPEPHYQLPPHSTSGQQGFFANNNNNNHSFTLHSLKDNESEIDPFEHDSDTETTMTATTNATNATIRNIRYGGSASSSDNFYSPRRADVGSGIGGLSLEDKPMRRITRSQTKQRMGGIGGDPYSRRYPTRR